MNKAMNMAKLRNAIAEIATKLLTTVVDEELVVESYGEFGQRKLAKNLASETSNEFGCRNQP